MALSPVEQTISAINQATRILIAPAAELNGDALGSSFGLANALEAAGKDVCIVLPEELPARYDFLPKPKRVTTDIPFDREFVLSIDTKAVPIKEMRYEQEGDFLKLYLTAPSHFSRDHLALEAGAHKHDLLITVGAVDMEALGATYEKHPGIFYDVPVLNVDRHPANERFGNINLVDVTASTIAEVMYGFLETWNPELLNEDIATCLLAAVIDGTRSFQDVSVTPRTLTTAAKLLDKGAKQTDVIRYLYKSRSMNQLRLWGTILGKLEYSEEYRIAHAILADADFAAVEYSPRDLPPLLEDLHSNFPHFPSIILFFVHQNGDTEPHTRGLMSSHEEHVLERVVRNFHAKRRMSIVSFKLDGTALIEAPAIFLKECFE
jgi:nanoRNase/pAp phosphatase (c-di-AMP/oligoRNAs hydrolase)